MSHAWEITPWDINDVLRKHGIGASLSEPTTDLLQDPRIAQCQAAVRAAEGRIERAALRYDDIDDQTASALDEIEDVLIEAGLIQGEKRFKAPDA